MRFLLGPASENTLYKRFSTKIVSTEILASVESAGVVDLRRLLLDDEGGGCTSIGSCSGERDLNDSPLAAGYGQYCFRMSFNQKPQTVGRRRNLWHFVISYRQTFEEYYCEIFRDRKAGKRVTRPGMSVGFASSIERLQQRRIDTRNGKLAKN